MLNIFQQQCLYMVFGVICLYIILQLQQLSWLAEVVRFNRFKF